MQIYCCVYQVQIEKKFTGRLNLQVDLTFFNLQVDLTFLKIAFPLTSEASLQWLNIND